MTTSPTPRGQGSNDVVSVSPVRRESPGGPSTCDGDRDRETAWSRCGWKIECERVMYRYVPICRPKLIKMRKVSLPGP